MKQNKTIEVTICDKCGKEAQCEKTREMDLCFDCQCLWDTFIHQKTKQIVNDYIDANVKTIFDDFKNATLKDLKIIKK